MTYQLVSNETLNASNSALSKDPEVDYVTPQNQMAQEKEAAINRFRAKAPIYGSIFNFRGAPENISHLLATKHVLHTPDR